MGRSPCCCGEAGVKKGPWTPEEDKKLVDYIGLNGLGSWRNLPRSAGLNRCGKSCRLRWTNYLRPDIKRGKFTEDEDRLIVHLHSVLGNKWSAIATKLPGRTDNEIKNYWNTRLRKKLLLMGIDPVTHRHHRTDLDVLASSLFGLLAAANIGNLAAAPWTSAMCADAAHLAEFQMLQSLARLVSPNGPPSADTTNLFSDTVQSSRQLEAALNGTLGVFNQDSVTTAAPWSLPSLRNTEVLVTTTDSTPSTGSADHLINPVEASANSSGPTQFEAWEGLNPNDDDLCWKDILEQMAWSNTGDDEGGASHSCE